MENGDYYIGNFKNNYKNGFFTYYLANGIRKEKIYFHNDNIYIEVNRLKRICCILIIIFIILLLFTITILCIYFLLKCEKGEKEKCLTCKSFSNDCKSCNPGYELIKGECVTYTFKATYYTDYDTKIKLINSTYIQYLLGMKIDDKFIEPTSEYSFENREISEIYFYFYKIKQYSFSYMFYNNEYIETISFNSLIDTKKLFEMDNMFTSSYNLNSVNFSNMNLENLESIKEIFSNCYSLISVDLSNINSPKLKNMYGMFSNCDSLINVNFSNFHTKNVEIMSNMFQGCSSLTTIDLSSFNTENIQKFYCMFCGCYRLTFVDISKFIINENNILFSDLPNEGTIILNEKYINNIKIIPSNWIIINSIEKEN